MSWNYRMVYLFAPAAIGWSLADVAEAMSAGAMNPTVFMVYFQFDFIKYDFFLYYVL